MPINVRPYHLALYVSCRTNSDQPASLIDFASLRFFSMWLTARLSIAITWFSLIKRVESLCRKSLRESAVLAYMRATSSLAFVRLTEPFCFLASRRCSLASLASFLRNAFGAAIFSPVERTTKSVNPKSMPTLPVDVGFAQTTSSQSRDTWYRPALSFDTVTVVTFAPDGILRDQRIASGASIFASFSEVPSHLKALAVYSADCAPSLRRKFGYLARLAKKFANAVCKWRNACWSGTELTSCPR